MNKGKKNQVATVMEDKLGLGYRLPFYVNFYVTLYVNKNTNVFSTKWITITLLIFILAVVYNAVSDIFILTSIMSVGSTLQLALTSEQIKERMGGVVENLDFLGSFLTDDIKEQLKGTDPELAPYMFSVKPAPQNGCADLNKVIEA